MMWGYEAGWGWMMGFGMLLFWGTVIFLMVWSVSRFTKQPSTDARRILEERFARGEIDEQEFHKRAALLSH